MAAASRFDKATPTPFDNVQAEKAEFEKYLEQNETESAMARFSRGDLIDAVVRGVSDRQVYLDIGQKQEGICDRDEFEVVPETGTTVSVVVVRSAGLEENTRVSHIDARRIESWKKVSEAHSDVIALTGQVKKELDNRKGYIVQYESLDLFLPQSHVSARSRGAQLKIGEKIDFRVLELNQERKSAIISRRVIQEEQDHEKWDSFARAHQVDEVIEGEIVRIVSFGVFIKCDGIDGLVHQSDVSWKPNRSVRDLYKKGEKVKAQILSIDVENRRLSLGLKQLTEDPWQWARRELSDGQTVQGVVTSITDYGAFVEIHEGLEGLIHISELSWLNKLKHPKRYFNVGDTIDIYLLSIDFDERRISLSFRMTRPNPWSNIAERVKVGDIRQGVVANITKFGAFVEIDDEIEGLIHFKDFSWDDQPDRKMLHKGQTVEFKILDIDAENKRISCGIKQLTPGPYEALKQKYKRGQEIEGTITNVTSFGIFVDIGEGFEGLVHRSQLPLHRDEKVEDRYTTGTKVKTILLKIDTDEKRISLSIKDYDKRQQKELMSKYMNPEQEGYSFGALLKNNLNKNDGSKE